MTSQARNSKSLIWPTALAGLLGGVMLTAAVLVAGPADAEPTTTVSVTLPQN